MDGRDHVRRAIRHYLEKDEDLDENPQDMTRLDASIQGAFLLARAAVAAARDIRDSALALPPFEPGRPSCLHRHYQAVWSFLRALWELIDFCELEQEVASSDVEDPVWFFGRALDQHLGGNPFEALTLLDEAGLGRDSVDPWVQMLRAEALAATGDQERAIAAWTAAGTLDPGMIEAHVSVAGELEALGRDREALGHWLAVRKALPADDPVSTEAKRHLVRLGQRLVRKPDADPGEKIVRLPRWGPSWVPAWPGKGRVAPEVPAARDEAPPGPAASDGPPSDESSPDQPPAIVSGAAAVAERRGSFHLLRDPERRDLTVAVVGGDAVSDGLGASRMACYQAGARLVGGPNPSLEDLEKAKPDVIVLASGVGPECVADIAERVRDGTLTSRAGAPDFLYNGPDALRADMKVIMSGLSLEILPDVAPPRTSDPEVELAGLLVAGGSVAGEPDAACAGVGAGPVTAEAASSAFTATLEAVRKRAEARTGGKPMTRRSLALGALAVTSALGWLDSPERWRDGRRPPFDLVVTLAEAAAIEAATVRGNELVGSTFCPEGAERGRLLEELYGELPKVLPAGDQALLVGRLLGESGPSLVPDGPEALVATSLVAGLLGRALRDLRTSLVAGPSYGLRSSHLLAAGSLVSRLPTPERALNAVLDGCQPVGVTRVLLDPHGIVTALGESLALGSLDPEDSTLADGTAALLAGSCLCVAPLVQAVKWGKPGRGVILEVSAKGAWRDGERTWQLGRGELLWIPLPAGRRVELVVKPAPPYNVGRGRGAEWRGEFVAGGLGLVLDGRGRPLKLPVAESDRTVLRAAWASELTGKASMA